MRTISAIPTRPRRRRLIATIAAALLAVGLASATASASTGATKPAAAKPAAGARARQQSTAALQAEAAKGSQVHYAVDVRVCPQATTPNVASCDAMRQVTVAKGTAGAQAVDSGGHGLAGGYTPHDLQTIYGYNPDLPRSNQLVALVDWFNDPRIHTDLKAFDTHYHLAAETTSSFRVVNENGRATPLPNSADGKQTATEIALDVETVRSVCHTCHILLVEADGPSDADLATAENTAARLGATEISNSFGEAEHTVAAATNAAYNHPGVVITASTGDDGWYGWDFLNNQNPPDVPQHAAGFPSTSPDVVAVGGIGETLTTPHTINVWNNNGKDDQQGLFDGEKLGAGGGGCSKIYTAKRFQSNYPGYTANRCHGHRLASDVSALADPNTGFDVLDRWGGSGWETIGGTSLASPMVAAMYALAGGSGDAPYPAAAIYENATLTPSDFFDMTDTGPGANGNGGGNGLCGGDLTASCGNFVFAHSDPPTHNPNGVGAGPVDCSFPRDGTDPASPPALDPECNSAPGLDGPTGVGVPVAGASLFAATNDAVTFHVPSVLRLGVSQTYTTNVTRRIATGHVAHYLWSWGDGTSTSTTRGTIKHDYRAAGTHTITLTVTDTLGQQTVRTRTITVGRLPVVVLTGSSRLTVGELGRFGGAQSRDPNTGGQISAIFWNWGDGSRRTSGAQATHRWSHAGTFTVTLTVVNSTGERNTATRRVVVRA